MKIYGPLPLTPPTRANNTLQLIYFFPIQQAFFSKTPSSLPTYPRWALLSCQIVPTPSPPTFPLLLPPFLQVTIKKLHNWQVCVLSIFFPEKISVGHLQSSPRPLPPTNNVKKLSYSVYWRVLLGMKLAFISPLFYHGGRRDGSGLRPTKFLQTGACSNYYYLSPFSILLFVPPDRADAMDRWDL